MDSTAIGFKPRHVIGPIRAAVQVKRLLDQRAWFYHLRREAIIRALASDAGEVREQVTVEAADMLCAYLDRTEIPGEVNVGLDRLSDWSRRTITHSVRYPEYRGAASVTFYRRLAHWVRDAVSTAEGQKALDYAGYPLSEQRVDVFAVAVANETRGLLAEAGLPRGQDALRATMMATIHRTDPDREIKERHKYVRRIVAAFSAGATTTYTYSLFADDWMQGLGLGGAAAAGAAITDYLVTRPKVRDDVAAARRQVRRWIQALPHLLLPYLMLRPSVVSSSGQNVRPLEDLLLALRKRHVNACSVVV